MIRIENLKKNYGAVRALDGLNLSVEAGAVYGFLGPNGAGKTTTLRILAGLAKANSGQAWIMEREVGKPGSDIHAMIGVMPEEPAFYPWMTAREYLRDFVAPLFGIQAGAAARRSAELLELVGLSEAGDRRVGGFSRGMRQRLGLAQALVHQPKVLLLDEPVSALDPAGRREVLDLIESLRGEITILFSTHILDDVERHCDRIGIINKGRMVVQDERDTLLQRYAAPLIEVEASNGFGNWPEQMRQMSWVENITLNGKVARLLVTDVNAARSPLLASLAESSLSVRRFEIVHPSLEDVFLRLTEKANL